MLTTTIQLSEVRDDVQLQTYILHQSEEFLTNVKRPAVIVCPGGAYLGTSDREAEPVALKFNSKGYHAFVLRYTTYYQNKEEFLKGLPGDNRSNFPQPLLDLATTIALIRKNADAWNIDPDQIIVMGFSAGGHLAASLGVHWQDDFLAELLSMSNDQIKPNALILGYPLLDYTLMKEETEKETDEMKLKIWKLANQAVFGTSEPTLEELKERTPVIYVSTATPPTFLWHTADDGLVYAQNSLRFATELAKHKVPYELHVFEHGVHGLSLCDETTAENETHISPHCEVWFDMALNWLKKRVNVKE